ncbi:MAG: LuxR family transcriptional regulator, partial [Ignavibacteriales bacterium]
ETNKVPHPLMSELMMAFHHDEKITYSLDNHLECIKKSRYSGDRIALIQQLLFLADRYLDEGKKKDALFLLEEVYQLNQSFHLGSALKLYTYRSSELLKKIDPKLELKKTESSLFTAKEHEILVYIEKGLNNEEIANKLFISIGTVKWHINHIFSKLDVKHRAEAVKKAKDQNYL